MELLTTRLDLLRSGDSFFSLQRFAPAAKKEIAMARRKGAKRVYSYHHFPDSFHHQLTSVAQKYHLLEDFYAQEKKALRSFQEIAITGTHGKTSVATLLQKGFFLGKRKWASVGTLGCVFPGLQKPISFGLTTCDLVDKYWAKGFALEQRLPLDGFIYEVSSHALAQQRHFGAQYEVSVVTDITFDEHRDYHKTPVEYLRAKGKLFEDYKANVRLIHQGNPLLRFLSPHSNLSVLPRTPRREARSLKEAFHLPHLDFVKKIFSLFSYSPGVDHGQWIDKVSVPGRLECYAWSGNRQVVVDYAHSPKALEYTLSLLKSYRHSQPLWVIFGCGGNRDKLKRPQMFEAVRCAADVIVITEDHNRGERFEDILSDILTFCPTSAFDKVKVIKRREEAIAYAHANAPEKTMIVLAGKGHETYEGRHFSEKNNNDVKQVKSYAAKNMSSVS